MEHRSTLAEEKDSGMNDQDYYERTRSQALQFYQECHALYNQDESYEDTIQDYEQILYSGELRPYAWFLFPKDVVISAKCDSYADWKCPEQTTVSFIAPEKYWPSVIAHEQKNSKVGSTSHVEAAGDKFVHYKNKNWGWFVSRFLCGGKSQTLPHCNIVLDK